MKTLYSKSRGLQVLFASVLIYALAFNLSGCGKENPVNNSQNPPALHWQLIFEKDSISFRGTNSGYVSIDTLMLLNTDSAMATFSIETDIDSLPNNSSARVTLNNRSIWLFMNDSISHFNNSYELFAPANDTVNGFAEITFIPGNSIRFIKIKGIKFYRYYN